MTDPLKALFGKPDYSHIVRDTTATISITAAEMAAVLEAYDKGYRHAGRHHQNGAGFRYIETQGRGMAMSMYYIKTGLEYWKPKGYGYTKSREEAGVFTLKDMEELNLDGCTLERAEVAFLDEDGPSPDLPHRVTLPRD